MKKLQTTMIIMLVIGFLSLLSVYGEGQPDVAVSNIALSKPGTFPVSKEKITISVICPGPTDAQRIFATNYFTKQLEEKTNIHIEWKHLNSQSFKEQLYLMFASGDLADVVVTGVGSTTRLDKSEEAQLGAQGLIIPLNNLIDTQSFWFKKAMEEQKGLKEFITTPDGNIYSLPNIDGSYHVMYPNKIWINTTWLKKLGLQMPKTTDELYKVLQAFRDNDPNGNGKKDEIPLTTIGKTGSGVDIDGFLMNAFTYAPGGDRFWVKNGKIVLNVTEPGYKEGLKYIQKLYKEGLLYKESFTQDQKTQVNLNESGEQPIIGAFLGLHFGYGASLTVQNLSTRWHQYNSIPPLQGPNGFRSATYLPYVKYITGLVTITSSCKYPAAAFRVFDYLFSEEGTIGAMFGREGKEWVKAGPADKGMDGRPAKWKQMNVDVKQPENVNITWDQLAANYRPEYFQFAWTFPQNPYDPAVNPMVGRMPLFYKASLEHEKYAPKLPNILPPLYYSQANIGELSQLKTTINDYIKESIVKFITSDANIDQEWNALLTQLDQLGLKRYIQIQQETYDKQYKK